MIKKIARAVSYRIIRILSSKYPVPADYTMQLTENIGRDFCNKDQPKALLCYIPFDLVNAVIGGEYDALQSAGIFSDDTLLHRQGLLP